MEKEIRKENIIDILLDVQGTLDDINEEKVKIFMKQIDRLRNKYKAEKVILHLSSHMHGVGGLLPYLEILHKNVLPNIILGDSFYLFGTYNYDTQEEEYKGFNFNARKTEVFEACLDKTKYKRVCIGLIDDSLSPKYITKFQNNEPIFIIRPSKKSIRDLQKDNLMCYSTQTKGFDGVLEGLDAYLANIKDIPYNHIVEEQKKVLLPLELDEIVEISINKKSDLTYKYVK